MNELTPTTIGLTAATADRRAFLTHLTLAGVGVGLLGMTGAAQAGGAGAPMKMGLSEKDFRLGVIGPAILFLITSQLAVRKATQANSREFAGLELREAMAVITVLKELKTPILKALNYVETRRLLDAWLRPK